MAPASVIPMSDTEKPEILAPAGDTACFLAALAAGADAVYVGLKHFSARMQADNFSVKELSRLAELARAKDRKIYVAMNSLLKPGDLEAAGRLIDRLGRHVRPHALIVQDLGAVELARQVGFAGEVHLSTLANVSHPAGLRVARELGVQRVILPRELSLDEVKSMAAACPEGLALEMFVHGALCYCVSGRCWWSSFMGGKSGLRGRCVQPCRRNYKRGSSKGRFFSCQDLSLDVLTKPLLEVPKVRSWKIEGRKKGPHYVYYTVAAYKLLRDAPDDPKAKKEAQSLLGQALGRPATHFAFLPQRPHNPTDNKQGTDSGMTAGKVIRGLKGGHILKTRSELIPGDLIRVGCEDEPWHNIVKISRRVPKGGSLDLRLRSGRFPPSGVLAFLVDRREPGLVKLLAQWGRELDAIRTLPDTASSFVFRPPKPFSAPSKPFQMMLRPNLPQGKAGKAGGKPALWLSPATVDRVSKTLYSRIWWWLPPVLWPDQEDKWSRLVGGAVRNGARHFVLNAPWQLELLRGASKVSATAGPFCNTANSAALAVLERMGFQSAVVAPELSGPELLALPSQSPLPLGIVLQGAWPLGVSRIKPNAVKQGEPLFSPKGEVHYSRTYGGNTWIYPNRPLDLTGHKQELEQAGYAFYIHIEEPLPSNVPEAGRSSSFNWDVELL